MVERIHRGLGRLIWRALLVSVVLAAIYVSSARVLLEALPGYREQLVASLSQTLEVRIDVESVSGRMEGFAPRLELKGLKLSYRTEAANTLELTSASMRISPWETLLEGELRLDSLKLDGAQILIDLAREDTDSSPVDVTALWAPIRVFEEVEVTDSRVILRSIHAPETQLQAAAAMVREGSARRIRLRLEDESGSSFTVEGQGIGNPMDRSRFVGELHGALKGAQLAPYFSHFGLSVATGGEVDFWYEQRDEKPSLALVTRLEDVAWKPRESPGVALDRLHFDLRLLLSDDGWSADLAALDVASSRGRFALPRLRAEQRGSGVAIALADLKVGDLTQLVLDTGLLGDRPSTIIGTLDPRGTVTALEAEIENLETPLSGWSVTAQVAGATTQPWKGVPGLYGIDATVEGSEAGATAWIDTDSFGLDLPRVYREALVFDRVTGRLGARWNADALYLEDGVLDVAAPEHDAKVRFGIDIPLDAKSGKGPPQAMYLDVGFNQTPVAVRDNYIPYKMNAGLRDWLETAIQSGRVQTGAFVWRGGFKGFGGGSQAMQVGLEIEQTTLAFQPDWPPIQDLAASVHIDTDRVSVWSEQARMASVALDDISAEANRRGRLRVTGGATSGLNDGLALLRDSPVRSRAGAVLDDLEGRGQVSATVSLDFEVKDLDALGVVVRTRIEDGELSSRTLKLSASDLAGTLDYSDGGFSTVDLGARLFGQPVSIAIGPGSSGMDGGSILDARFSARAPVAELAPWLEDLLLSGASGFEYPVSGDVGVAVDLVVGDRSRARVRSDGLGFAVALPEPLGKTAESPGAFTLDFDLSGNSPWELLWQDRVAARLYRSQGDFVGAALALSPNVSRADLIDPENEKGIYVGGSIARLDISAWLDALTPTTPVPTDIGALPRVEVARIDVEELLVGGTNLGAVALDLTPYDSWDMLGINAEWLDAELAIDRAEGGSRLIVNTLDLDALPDFGGGEQRTEFARPPTLNAPVEIVVANMAYRGDSLGAVRFTLESRDGALRVYDLAGDLADISIREGSELRWQPDAEGAYGTQIVVDTVLEDLAGTFEQLGLEPVIESRDGVLVGSLDWPGGPDQINLTDLEGELSLSLSDGSFLPAPSGATGFIRLLSALNLAGLFSKADVTRLFEPGVTFERASGDLLFGGGVVKVPNFVVDADGGGFTFDSDIDLIEEQIDGELVVTLPLAQNVPWVAALVAGLPVAAGAYIVSKVFEKQVKSLSSGVYSVSGPLSEPEVKFERIFDASSDLERPSPEAESQPKSSEPAVPSPGDESPSPEPLAASSSSRR